MAKKEYHQKTKEEKIKEIEEGEVEGDVYSEEGREALQDDEDEITDLDEGFMEGYEEGEHIAKCALCHKIISDVPYEREIDGINYMFCSEEHAAIYEEQKRKGNLEEEPEEEF